MNKGSTQPPAVVPDDQQKSASESGIHKVLVFIRECVLVVLIALIVTSLLRVFVFQVFKVPSGSMEHTLNEQDRIVALRIGDFQRGDVVVFKDPDATWMGPKEPTSNPVLRALEKVYLLPDSSQGYLVKRVIGMPGDHVACCDAQGRVTVNGVALDEESYLYHDSSGIAVAPSDTAFDVIVPEGHLFMMGDHRNRSGDSRLHLCETIPGKTKGEHAFIPLDDVVGRVSTIIFPFTRIHQFDIPDTFESIPDPSQPAPEEAVIDPISCAG